MARVEAIKAVTSVTLELDAKEAGYLLDLLAAHVGGRLTLDTQPLGRIREALRTADVERIRAYRDLARRGLPYAALYESRADAERG